MTFKPPKTLEEFEAVLKYILELQENPYCNNSMLKTLEKKREQVEAEIIKLKKIIK